MQNVVHEKGIMRFAEVVSQLSTIRRSIEWSESAIKLSLKVISFDCRLLGTKIRDNSLLGDIHQNDKRQLSLSRLRKFKQPSPKLPLTVYK